MFLVFEVIGSVQIRDFADQIVYLDRDALVVRVSDRIAINWRRVSRRSSCGSNSVTFFMKVAAV
jgi:hypothetical protein